MCFTRSVAFCSASSNNRSIFGTSPDLAARTLTAQIGIVYLNVLFEDIAFLAVRGSFVP